MFSPFRFVLNRQRLTVMGSLAAIVLSAAPAGQAQLLLEQPQGGPLEYREVAENNHSADFRLRGSIGRGPFLYFYVYA